MAKIAKKAAQPAKRVVTPANRKTVNTKPVGIDYDAMEKRVIARLSQNKAIMDGFVESPKPKNPEYHGESAGAAIKQQSPSQEAIHRIETNLERIAHSVTALNHLRAKLNGDKVGEILPIVPYTSMIGHLEALSGQSNYLADQLELETNLLHQLI